ERDASERQHGARMLGIERENGPERGARGAAVAERGVEIPAEQEGQRILWFAPEHLAGERGTVLEASLAAIPLDALEELHAAGGQSRPPDSLPDAGQHTHAVMIADAPVVTNFLALSVANTAGQVVQVLEGGRGQEGREAGGVALAVGEGLPHAG